MFCSVNRSDVLGLSRELLLKPPAPDSDEDEEEAPSEQHLAQGVSVTFEGEPGQGTPCVLLALPSTAVPH